MNGAPDLAGILEAVVYHDAAEREATRRFYSKVLGLAEVAAWESGAAYRVGPGVVLVFDRARLAATDSPVAAHGTAGPGHVCLRAGAGRYDELRARLAAAGVAIRHDHEWPRGGRSFYFADPAGNLLEVADRDIWPD